MVFKKVLHCLWLEEQHLFRICLDNFCEGLLLTANENFATHKSLERSFTNLFIFLIYRSRKPSCYPTLTQNHNISIPVATSACERIYLVEFNQLGKELFFILNQQ